MTTLTDTSSHPASVSGMAPAGPQQPQHLPEHQQHHEPLTPAPAPASAPLTQQPAPFIFSSQDSASFESARPKSLIISTSDIPSTLNHAAAVTDDSTPPTSAISSQAESQATDPAEVLDRKQSVVQNLKIEAAQDSRSTSNSQSPEPNSLSGTKRTATGQLKRSSVNGLGEVIARSNGISHARTSSMVSNGSNSNGNVLEVSQQLRTKLKYAMIKVQNGWQSRTFDEVESLASQSPRSTVSGFQHFGDGPTLLSPRTVMARKYHRESSESDSSDSTKAMEHRGLVSMVTSPPAPSRRALAPPLDIMPSSRRRPTPNALHHNVNGSQMRHLHSSRPVTSQRTPSQNAAMEADAVETLLFMASPNNSGYNPPNRASQESSNRAQQFFASQTSPLRTQFSQTSMTSPKRVAFSDDSFNTAKSDRAALIDRMLDELSDDSDDDLERAFRLAEKGKTRANPVST